MRATCWRRAWCSLVEAPQTAVATPVTIKMLAFIRIVGYIVILLAYIYPYCWLFSGTPASAGQYQALALSTGWLVAAGFGEAPQCPRSTFQPPWFQNTQQ